MSYYRFPQIPLIAQIGKAFCVFCEICGANSADKIWLTGTLVWPGLHLRNKPVVFIADHVCCKFSGHIHRVLAGNNNRLSVGAIHYGWIIFYRTGHNLILIFDNLHIFEWRKKGVNRIPSFNDGLIPMSYFRIGRKQLRDRVSLHFKNQSLISFYYVLRSLLCRKL